MEMKKTYPAIVMIVISLLILVTGCVSQPAPDKTNALDAPDWALKKPNDDASYKYFVGSGNSSKGNAVDAEKIAVQDIIDQIILYIGVQITSNTTATAKASLDKFEADLTQTVTTKGATNVAGFEVQEKFPISRKNGEFMMYILARYDKKALEKQKKEMEKIFQERKDAIDIPHNEGISLMGQGKYYEAVAKFLAAASAASKSEVQNAGIYFEENINLAMECVEHINFVKLNDNLEGLVGNPLPEPFKLKVVTGMNESDKGVPDANVVVNYVELSSNGKRRDRRMSVKTDDSGVIAFEHPIPQFVGSEKVTMYLDIGPYLESLEDIPSGKENILEGLEDLAVSKKAVFQYSVSSNAKNISTGLVILDLDEDDTPMSKSATQASILAALTAEKFKVRNLSINPKELKDKSDYDIIEMLTKKFKNQVERVIFGTVRVLSYTENDGMKFAKCTATVQIVDLGTGEVLLTLVKNTNGMGADDNTAAANGFKSIGTGLGKDIKNQLK
ncbi:MAG: hypothetical protein JW969_14225 [Spirochaetales bacterium]|nr:hypothetical protein [Spirochaetales bacterium]